MSRGISRLEGMVKNSNREITVGMKDTVAGIGEILCVECRIARAGNFCCSFTFYPFCFVWLKHLPCIRARSLRAFRDFFVLSHNIVR